MGEEHRAARTSLGTTANHSSVVLETMKGPRHPSFHNHTKDTHSSRESKGLGSCVLGMEHENQIVIFNSITQRFLVSSKELGGEGAVKHEPPGSVSGTDHQIRSSLHVGLR